MHWCGSTINQYLNSDLRLLNNFLLEAFWKLSKLWLTFHFDFIQFSIRFTVSLSFCFLIWNGHRNSTCAFVRAINVAALLPGDSAEWISLGAAEVRTDRCDVACASWTVCLWLSFETLCLHRNALDVQRSETCCLDVWIYCWRISQLWTQAFQMKIQNLVDNNWKTKSLKVHLILSTEIFLYWTIFV